MLYLAEALLAHFGKDFRHRLAPAVLDIPVQVIERDAQFLGECLAYGRLAGSHVAYQNYSFHHNFEMRNEK